MAGFTGLDDFVSKATGANVEYMTIHKEARASGVAVQVPISGKWQSIWTQDGNPTAGAAPGAAARICTNATTGALGQTDAGGGRTKWLTCWAGTVRGISSGGSICTTLLYDRLCDYSGLDGTSVAAQTTTGLIPTRYTNGVGNEIWVEVFTSIGITARTATVSYKNESGATKTSATFDIGGSLAALESATTRFFQVPLATGDKGVTEVISITLSASTGTVGDFGLVVIHPLSHLVQTGPATLAIDDYVVRSPYPIEIKAGACLAFAIVGTVAAANQPIYQFCFVEA